MFHTNTRVASETIELHGLSVDYSTLEKLQRREIYLNDMPVAYW